MAQFQCRFDTGSMSDCQPACSAPATRLLSYDGYGGRYTIELCQPHVAPMRGRVFPSKATVSEIH